MLKKLFAEALANDPLEVIPKFEEVKILTLDGYLLDSERTEKKFPEGKMMTQEEMELLHGIMGIVTEAGELMDAMKKHIIYGAPIDQVNIREELGDVMFYWALICRLYGWDPHEVLQINIDKLKARFPDKFNEVDALNRDLTKERGILEGSKSDQILEESVNAECGC